MDHENFLYKLENIIESRKKSADSSSYTAGLFASGLERMLQKTGEESVEYILAAMGNSREKTISQAADLFFHLLVSLSAANITLKDIEDELKKRHKNSGNP